MGEGGQGFRREGRLIDSLPTHPRLAEWTSRDGRRSSNLPHPRESGDPFETGATFQLPSPPRKRGSIRNGRNFPTSVIPAKAEIHFATVKNEWLPAQLPK